MSERHKHTCACCKCLFICYFGCEPGDRTPVYCDACASADHAPCVVAKTDEPLRPLAEDKEW